MVDRPLLLIRFLEIAASLRSLCCRLAVRVKVGFGLFVFVLLGDVDVVNNVCYVGH